MNNDKTEQITSFKGRRQIPFPPLVRKKHVHLDTSSSSTNIKPYDFHFSAPYEVQIEARSFTNGRMCLQHTINDLKKEHEENKNKNDKGKQQQQQTTSNFPSTPLTGLCTPHDA